MKVQKNVSLKNHSTMRLGGNTKYLVEVSTKQELAQAITWAKDRKLPFMAIGHGSNIVWRDEGYGGLIIVNNIRGYKESAVEDKTVEVTVGAGEVWDDVVRRTVEAGLSGVETLSLIPGTAGATPVQNVGAYGSEMSQVLTAIEAFEVQNDEFVTLHPEDCGFAYRKSKFKNLWKEKYVISSITLQLTKNHKKPPFYGSLQKYLTDHQIADYSPASLRKAVIAIRSQKLPDPARVPNNGSFFQNPIVDNQKAQELIAKYPGLAHWKLDDKNVKISAAWLVEQAGFKAFFDAETGMKTWKHQPLVLVNEHAKSTQDLLDFKAKVVSGVKQKFGIELVQEPELLP